ncbi:MAG TPA: FAD-dependent oxidoreductase [Candidatus Limnocylindrales bacterium]|nr:FAD-dependent oxidoreductase [Candidatus Limnocylindrales bacterium]
MGGAAKLNRIVVVGGGLAGGNAARTLREEGYGGEVLLITNEPGIPFGRPPLSKTYLRGEETLDGWLVAPGDWYAAHGVELTRGTVGRIDPRSHRVFLREGNKIEYTRLLIATGGRNRAPGIPGDSLDGVYQLRTVGEADAIKRAARPGAHAVVVGMGFIGCEVTASLRQLGVSVTSVFPGDAPLDSVLGPEMASVMAAIHREGGAELLAHDQVLRFEGQTKVERAVTRAGRTIECDFAVVAVGIQPNVEFLQGSGVDVDNGVPTDAMCRTNMPHIFAAGDVANHMHPLFGRTRVEHYNNAEKQGRSVARAMLGSNEEYDYLYTFWSDQYDHKIEYAGHVRRWDQFVVRGSLEERKLVGFYLVDGVVRAAVGLNRGGDPELEPDSEMAAAALLIRDRATPSARDLADEDHDLTQAGTSRRPEA